MNQNNNGFIGVLVCGVLFAALIGSCNTASQSVSTSGGSQSYSTNTSVPYTSSPSPTPRNDYQDMRNRGHSEEDAIIFGILKQQGYSDYDAINAVQSSKK